MPIWKIRPDIDLYAFFVAGFGMDVIRQRVLPLLEKGIGWEDSLLFMKNRISMEDIELYGGPILEKIDVPTLKRILYYFKNVKDIYEQVIPLMEEIDVTTIYILTKMNDMTLDELYNDLLPVLQQARRNDEQCGIMNKQITTRFILEEMSESRMTIAQAKNMVDIHTKRKCNTVIEPMFAKKKKIVQ